MKLEHYFRLIVMSIFQSMITYNKKNYGEERMAYGNQMFFCPAIHCKDGFKVSLQIHNGNYCSSENGYRTMGIDWKELEFGFPSMNEKDMWQYSEMWGSSEFDDEEFDVTETVGRIPTDKMQAICEKHGGIDWDATLSKEAADKFINRK